MPELPEVETMCRCVAPAVGCRISGLERPKSRLQSILISPRLDCFRRRILGKRIEAVRRVGKRVVLELECEYAAYPHPNPLPKGDGTRRCPHPNPLPKGEGTWQPHGECIVLEPRMTGLVLLAQPPDREHVRLIFRLTGGPAKQILFWDQRGLGVARLLGHREFIEHYGDDYLGPDALSITIDSLRERLGKSRRAIKVALLDQHALAGVGNLYASEILHLARIHPAVPCHRLKANEWSKLHAAMGTILRAAIRHQGSTLRDGTYRIARNSPGDYQLYHRVYQRAGEQCAGCGNAAIVRIVQAQRSTFFCPACQRPCSSRQ
jgi:formamidopyrimidine-DNA glycosylase